LRDQDEECINFLYDLLIQKWPIGKKNFGHFFIPIIKWQMA
jgi:hypothetical protein